jgi:hypothetical protein
MNADAKTSVQILTPKNYVPWHLEKPDNERFSKTRSVFFHKNEVFVTQEALTFGTQFYLRALLRKEVIQPQVLLQLPCYDFTPITKFTIET